MKYIVISTPEQELPVIFPNELVHRLVGQALIKMLHHFNRTSDGLSVVAAGEIHVTPMGVMCSGKSETLGVGSRPEDAILILQHDYLHGMKDLPEARDPNVCTDCQEPLGTQHKPSCHRQGLVTKDSVYIVIDTEPKEKPNAKRR